MEDTTIINTKGREVLFRNRIFSINEYLLYLPLLVLYIAIVLIFSRDVFQGDEGRYIWFAKNLIQGFYSPPAPNINLWNGPGYPIILIPFVLLKLPFIFIKLLNALFLYFSGIFFSKTLKLYNIDKKKMILYSYIIFGLYYLPFQLLPLILPEIFTIFLISAFAYRICCLYQNKSKKFGEMLIPSILLACIALTKVIFGYVILACLLLLILIYFIKKLVKMKIIIIVCLLALLFCIPYLIYTYSLTNKIFYWANSGEESLYWMSSPYENEFGDWGGHNGGKTENLKRKHQSFFNSIAELPAIERNEAYKRKAIENIKERPKKYFMNWLANIGRMLFSYPYSYARQTLKTYFTIVPNMFIVVFSILFLYPTIKLRKKIPQEILLLLVFVMIYLFGSSLLSAYRRQFFIVIPIIGLWLVYMFNNLMKIDSNFGGKL